jgi:hypothetical protein
MSTSSTNGDRPSFGTSPIVFTLIGLGVLMLAAVMLLFSRRMRTYAMRDHPYFAPRTMGLGLLVYGSRDMYDEHEHRMVPKLWDVRLVQDKPAAKKWEDVQVWSPRTYRRLSGLSLTQTICQPFSVTPTPTTSSDVAKSSPADTRQRAPLFARNRDPLPTTLSPQSRNLTLAVAVVMPSSTSLRQVPEYCIGTSAHVVDAAILRTASSGSGFEGLQTGPS